MIPEISKKLSHFYIVTVVTGLDIKHSHVVVEYKSCPERETFFLLSFKYKLFIVVSKNKKYDV